jgi:hypothetical protein
MEGEAEFFGGLSPCAGKLIHGKLLARSAQLRRLTA